MKKKGKNGINGKSEDAVFTVVIYEWTLVAEEAKATGEYGMQYVGQTNDPNSRKLDFYNENIDYSAPGSKLIRPDMDTARTRTNGNIKNSIEDSTNRKNCAERGVMN